VQQSLEPLVKGGTVQKMCQRVVLGPERELFVQTAPFDREGREASP
jgi:hypothetical protein